MDELQNLMLGFGVALTLPNIGFMLIGITLGVLIGVLPGLGGANGVAILLPLTFSMNPTSAIIMLSCIYWGALFGGAITSILFNIPGEPWSVATTFDGYPMAQQGRAAQALTAAFTSSFVGAIFAVLLITFTAPWLAKFALKFGPAEFFAVQLLTFCSFVGMSKEPPAKTIAAMMLGFGLAAVGMDTVTGQLRMTYGQTELLKGFGFLIAVIGLFGIGEILLTMEEGLAFKGKSAKIDFKVVWQTWGELLRHWRVFLRSVAVGCWMGITPGGATPASFMSYGMARRMSKDPASFGQGRIEGVVAPETAAHAAGTAAYVDAGHTRLAHRGGAAGRLAHLGLAARAHAVCGAKRVCLGPHCQHVRGQHRGPDRGADHGTLVGRHLAHPVFDHRAGHHRHLCHRRLHRQQRHV
jgi:putative tricarboxylic transport membrane protein